MYFGLSEEQVSLEETIKKYLEDNASLEVIKEIASGNHEKAEIIHRGLIDLGISGLLVPEKYGGLELDILFASVVSSALGSGTAPVPFVGAYVMAPLALNLAGSKIQKDDIASAFFYNYNRPQCRISSSCCTTIRLDNGAIDVRK